MENFIARLSNQSNEERPARKAPFYPLKWTARRELTGHLYGHTSFTHNSIVADYSKGRFYKDLYYSFAHAKSWNKSSGSLYRYGAIFNFDFSPDGLTISCQVVIATYPIGDESKIFFNQAVENSGKKEICKLLGQNSTLVTACERRSLLMFDPLNYSMYRAKTNAHADCVNVVKFIDSRLFATCSDDRKVKLWDLRNTDKELQCLSGHSNWVKNMEVVDGKLLTSGFDGNVILWDHETYTENGEVPHQIIFQTRNLMRTAVSEGGDHQKLVMSTSSGYIIVVHDLDINYLAADLKGFKPNIYRLMQMNPGVANDSIAFNHLFNENRPKNRLEMLTDFSSNVNVEIIASLKMHPSGDYLVSRYSSTDEYSEHTCVHDLRDAKIWKLLKEPEVTTNNSDVQNTSPSPQYFLSLQIDNTAGNSSNTTGRSGTRLGRHNSRDRSRSRSLQRSETASDGTPSTETTNSSDLLSRQLGSAQQRLGGLAATYASTNEHVMIFIQGDTDGVQQTFVVLSDDESHYTPRPRVPVPPKDSRLTYYIEEPNLGQGYIKEQSFSNDGRIICSPFAHGVRLLGFDSECRSIDEKSIPQKSTKLHEVACMYTHQDLVVATKYSPTHNLLVTGCLDGQVCFHQPVL